MYRASDGSLHENRKAWRARQSWLELVQLADGLLNTNAVGASMASDLLERRDEVTRLLRHAVEPTEEAT
jgi:hypothetical protein